MKYKLSAGIWEYWFRDKNTLTPLSPKLYIGELTMNETEVYLMLPDNLVGNDDVEIVIRRAL